MTASIALTEEQAEFIWDLLSDYGDLFETVNGNTPETRSDLQIIAAAMDLLEVDGGEKLLGGPLGVVEVSRLWRGDNKKELL